MAAALIALVPTFFLGNVSGHDFEFHLNSWMEVQHQWSLGIWHPHWASLAHYGYGEPRFIFYPPASWTLGAALGEFLPWKVVPDAFIWIALTLSGCSMFLLACRFLSRADATLAAAFYAVNPYYLVVIYWRSALAELLAAALLPLLLLCVLDAERKRGHMIAPLGLVLAWAWLTNVPAAVMTHYSLALLVAILAWKKRSPRLLLYSTAAVVLGIMLAGFYLGPAIYQQRWIEVRQLFAPGVRPADNFLFTNIGDTDHDHFNRVMSWLGVLELTAVAAILLLAIKRTRPGKTLVWSLLCGWSALCFLSMVRISDAAWNHMPFFQYAQLPWRWLSCLGVTLCLLLPLAWKRWPTRLVMCALMIAVLPLLNRTVQNVWWDTAADINEIQDNQQTGYGYDGVDEYVPRTADGAAIKPDAPLVTLVGDSQGQIALGSWLPESRNFTVVSGTPVAVQVRLFRYRGWNVEVNGEPVSHWLGPDNGEIMIPLQAGVNHVHVFFSPTWDVKAGALISCCGVLVWLGLILWKWGWYQDTETFTV